MSSNWIEFFLGFWLIASPWLLGFSSISVMKWGNVLVGIVLVLINAWVIFGKADAPPAHQNVAPQMHGNNSK